MTTTQTPVDAWMALVDKYAEAFRWNEFARAVELRAELEASARALAAIPAEEAERIADVNYQRGEEIGYRMGQRSMQLNRAAAPTPPTAPAQASEGAAPLLSRAIELHEKAGMPWVDAEELALNEAGIDDAVLDELIGNCAYSGLSSILAGEDELRQFTRSVLVHQPFAALRASSPADTREPLTDEMRSTITKMWRKENRNYTVGDIIDAVERAHGIGVDE